MEMMTKIIKNIDSWVWGLPLILLILFVRYLADVSYPRIADTSNRSGTEIHGQE